MMEAGWWQWVIALVGALTVHGVLMVGFKPTVSGAATPPAGTSVSVSGSLASVLGGAVEARAVQASDARAKRVTGHPVENAVPAEIARAVVPEASQHRRAEASVPVVPRVATAQPVAPVPIMPAIPVEPVERKDVQPIEPVKQRAQKVKQSRPKFEAERKRARSREADRRIPQATRSTTSQRRGSLRDGAAGSSKGGRGSSRVSAGVMRAYGMRLYQIIKRQPVNASGHGQALITFAVTRSGALSFVRVSRSSGQARLDRAAVAAVRGASPFPPPPADATSRQLTFVIPFTFR
jgi:periplasmic protein TonB